MYASRSVRHSEASLSIRIPFVAYHCDRAHNTKSFITEGNLLQLLHTHTHVCVPAQHMYHIDIICIYNIYLCLRCIHSVQLKATHSFIFTYVRNGTNKNLHAMFVHIRFQQIVLIHLFRCATLCIPDFFFLYELYLYIFMYLYNIGAICVFTSYINCETDCIRETIINRKVSETCFADGKYISSSVQ